MKGKHIEFAAGLVAGAVLFGGGAAYAAGILAERSYQPIYVNGQPVQMEAYAINGHNYVKLRDVGRAVGFNVYWDGANVQIESGKPYTGEPPTAALTAESANYAQAANPAVFQGELTGEVYNAIRETMANHDAIAAGSMKPIPVGKITPYGDVDSAAIAIGRYPAYEVIYQSGGNYACAAKDPEAYQPAVAHTQDFVDGLAEMTDREKVKAIACYVADRITYAVKYPSPGEVLTQDGQVPGACMAYAYSFQFLCNRAGIPCLLIHSDIHQWNKVYVDGAWWDVDVTGFDTGDDTQIRDSYPILSSPEDMQGATYVDCEPNVTVFAQELLVPGSTK